MKKHRYIRLYPMSNALNLGYIIALTGIPQLDENKTQITKLINSFHFFINQLTNVVTPLIL